MSTATWVEGPDGYGLALEDGKLVCRNPKGKQLASVPKNVRDSEQATRLLALRDWLAEHERACKETVEQWMLRSLPVPRRAIEALWPDPAWRTALENAVVQGAQADGTPMPDALGFLRGAKADGGIGVVTLDGETDWIDAPCAVLPHPILLAELDDWRELATELGLKQGIAQLFRETFARPADLDAESHAVGQFAGGKFEELNHALGRCRTLGYRVSGGYAVLPVWEGGRLVEARFWIGSDDPEYETETDDLTWVDDRERGLSVGEVGPVAFSEGMRMASAIYAGRAVEKQEEDA
jgi:hypothetical protein